MAELSSEVQELRRQLASERQARQQAEQQLQELVEEHEESRGSGGAAAAAELQALKAKNAKLKERYKVGKVWKRGTFHWCTLGLLCVQGYLYCLRWFSGPLQGMPVTMVGLALLQ